jgi:hypothetical protein
VTDVPRQRSRETSRVRRITIDEKVGEKLIRALICGLADGVHEFSDQPQDWGEEKEFPIRPQTYAKMMGLPPEAEYQKQYPWDGLSEGQVFLSGEFEVTDDPKAPTQFKVSPGRREFVRIDQVKFFRERLKTQYSRLLQRKS